MSGPTGVSGQTGVSSFQDIETLLLSLKVVCGGGCIWIIASSLVPFQDSL